VPDAHLAALAIARRWPSRGVGHRAWLRALLDRRRLRPLPRAPVEESPRLIRGGSSGRAGRIWRGARAHSGEPVPTQTRIPFTTVPWTSVRRKARPW
jgi:hypothetical protein